MYVSMVRDFTGAGPGNTYKTLSELVAVLKVFAMLGHDKAQMAYRYPLLLIEEFGAFIQGFDIGVH